jgi:hypothetical protein
MNATVTRALSRTFDIDTARRAAIAQEAVYGRRSSLAQTDHYGLIAWAKKHYGTSSEAALMGPPPSNIDSLRSVARQLLSELVARHDEIPRDSDAGYRRLKADLGYAATLAEVALTTWEAIQAA